MAFASGKNAVFKLDDGAGSLTDISTYINSANLQTSQGTYDVTTLSATYRAFILGFGDWKLSVKGFYDETIDGYLAGADSASRSVEFYPKGTPTGSGKPKYSGEVIKVSYTGPTVEVDGAETWELELQGTGALSRAVA
jgi:hypothetical protein